MKTEKKEREEEHKTEKDKQKTRVKTAFKQKTLNEKDHITKQT